MLDIKQLKTFNDYISKADAISHLENLPFKFRMGSWENITFPEKLDHILLPVEYTNRGLLDEAILRMNNFVFKVSFSGRSDTDNAIYGIIGYSAHQTTYEEITEEFSKITGGNKYTPPQVEGSTRLDVLDVGPFGLTTDRKRLRVRNLNFEFFENGIEQEFINLCKEIPKGGIHVLHGPPGTGKTSFITALAQELSDDVVFIYPKFDVANGLEQIVSHLKESYGSHTCLVIENGEEIFDSATQAMLNVGDGILSLIGAYNLSILITSNREGDDIINNIHEAMSRKGRMRSFVHLPFYSEDKAHELLFKYKLPELPNSLADLYAMLEQADEVPVVSITPDTDDDILEAA